MSSCAAYGIAPPSVTTLVVDPANTASRALVVSPSCSVQTPLVATKINSNTETRISATDLQLGAVVSYPSVDSLDLSNNAITSFRANTSTINELILTNNKLKNLDGITLPDGLKRLFLDENPITSVSPSDFPSSFSELYMSDTPVSSLVQFEFPSQLAKLILRGSKQLTTLEGLVLPPTLSELDISNGGVTSVVGVAFPASITKVIIAGTKPVTAFNIRASDVALLQKIQLQVQGAASITSCATGTLTTIKSDANACVIDDTEFARMYPPPPRTKKPTTTTSPTSGDSTPTSTPTTSTSGGSNTTQIVLIAVIVLVAVAVGAMLAYMFLRRRAARRSERASDGHTKATRTKTRTANHTDEPPLTGSNYTGFLDNDVRNDPALIPYRLPQEELVIVDEIAKGGFGVVYRAKLYSNQVVVKQVSPLKTNSADLLRRFMDEIRLYAHLDHPKIVRFVGLAWTNLLDLSLVMEYMPNGDLHALLRANNRLPPDQQTLQWFADSSESVVRCKALMAQDIAEALVYLHSFTSPIIHRDLKAKNVLLSSDYVAKLGDFGISREASSEETMTGGVGTTAWIAPEVLQGERYSERADIYSFGIFMCEMDSCGHPYNSNKTGEDSMTDAKIAYLVSTASLKPTLKDDCPRAIQKIIMQCLEFDPAKRPTALELHYNLRKIREASLEWGFICETH